jgi:hypothetical protein
MLLKFRAAHKQLLRGGLLQALESSGGQQAPDYSAISGSAPPVRQLDDLFQQEMHRLEDEIRRNLAPIIARALSVSGLGPANRVEEVARNKVVAELLDRVCERGYLRFGDLRDAVARNQLKMADVAGPVELIAGDSLLRADTRLAYDLDGIYRRGEFYLRLLQRGSSLFFGTRPGRLIFLYLIAPFLAAFLTLTFAIEIKHISRDIFAFASKTLAPRQQPRSASRAAAATGESVLYVKDEHGKLVAIDLDEYEWDEDGNLVWVDHPLQYEWDDEGNLISFDPDDFFMLTRTAFTSTASKVPVEGKEHESALPTWEPVFIFGLFLLLVFHVPPFRRALVSVLGGMLAVLRSLLWEIPAKIVRSPSVVAIRYSAPVRILGRYFSGAFLVTAGAVLLLAFLGAPAGRLLRWGGVVFAVATIALNTPWGWALQERLAESIADGWRVVRVNLLPGLVATIIDWFRRLANWIERQLYAVDEWLRFRGGDSQGSLIVKALIGLFWFPFAYLARFAFYLLIEPQINPVKHFPVVTVSHKVILPLTPNLAEALNVSNGTAVSLLAGVPGVFGFIAWELLANWRLYAANRPRRLKPVVIGSHGETLRGLLRPGFHSGTVPKLYRKLRRAEHRDNRLGAASLRHDLQHAGEAVHRFIERELVAILKGCPETRDLRMTVENVRFGCQRAIVSIAAPDLGPDCMVLAFENQGERIAATVEQFGWLDKLTAAQRDAAFAAVRGLLDMAATEIYQGSERTRDSAGNGLSRTFTWEEWVNRWK